MRYTLLLDAYKHSKKIKELKDDYFLSTLLLIVCVNSNY